MEVRSNRDLIDKLLHDDFVEFGRSGKAYDKSQILKELQDFKGTLEISSSDFEFKLIDEAVVLVTYKSAHLNSSNEETRHSLRSSIWQKTEQGWQMRFHQGTAF